jgi:PAS domain-containing protein
MGKKKQPAKREIVGSGAGISGSRRAEVEPRVSEKRFDLALEGTGAGVWDWDMVKDEVVYSIQ